MPPPVPTAEDLEQALTDYQVEHLGADAATPLCANCAAWGDAVGVHCQSWLKMFPFFSTLYMANPQPVKSEVIALIHLAVMLGARAQVIASARVMDVAELQSLFEREAV